MESFNLKMLIMSKKKEGMRILDKWVKGREEKPISHNKIMDKQTMLIEKFSSWLVSFPQQKVTVKNEKKKDPSFKQQAIQLDSKDRDFLRVKIKMKKVIKHKWTKKQAHVVILVCVKTDFKKKAKQKR